MLHQFEQVNQSERKVKQENDFLLSFDELKRRAEVGDSSARLLIGLAYLYGEKDRIINQDEGSKWIELARKDTNSRAGLCAQGVCYESAIGEVKFKKFDKAKEFYSQAAESGYIPAIYRLAFMLKNEAITTTESSSDYQTATHTHKDEEKLATVIKLYTLCAEVGYAPAQNQLGVCYAKGYGVPKDEKEALKLFRMAADSGYSRSRSNIGVAYEHGLGVKVNISEAKKWYKLAAAQGDEDSKEKIKELRCMVQ